MAASVLRAIQMRALVAHSQVEYELVAGRLVTSMTLLQQLQDVLVSPVYGSVPRLLLLVPCIGLAC